MDLGISGKAALICGASRGLGRACALSLAREGCRVTIVARNRQTIERTADELRALTGVPVTAVAADIVTMTGRAAALAACPAPDILVTNAGGPPAGDFRHFTREDWMAAIDANMLTPIELIKATVDSMIDRRFGRIVNITSGAVKAPIDVLALSNGARAGLTGFIAGLSRSVAQYNVTINNLLPGSFDTDRLRQLNAAQAKIRSVGEEATWAERIRAIPAGRAGDPLEFGETCAFLCGVNAGFITGQNVLMDGGAYPGTF